MTLASNRSINLIENIKINVLSQLTSDLIKILLVCRNMEIRFSNTSKNGSRNVEICANDQWLVAISGGITVAADVHSQMSNSFNFTVNVLRVSTTSVSLTWSQTSTANNSMNQNISKYHILCTTMFQEWIYVVKVAGVHKTTNSIQISGLLPDSVYNCCVTAHILINLPIEVINSACTTVKTLVSPSDLKYQSVVIALGTGLFVCCLILLCTCISFMLWIVKTKSKSLEV